MTNNPELETDDQLMVRFQRGDATAFEAIYDRHGASLFALCLRLLGSPEEAEDALQDAFTKVVDARDSYEPRGRFRGWIFAIARFTCMDRLRAAKSERQTLERMDRRDRVEASETRTLARTDVTRLLMDLPVDQREVLVLHRFHGFSQAEIASMLGSTEAAVRQKAYRALKALQSRIVGERDA